MTRSHLASRQEGVVGRAQLHTLGISDNQIRLDEKAGVLQRVHKDVWAVGHLSLTPLGHLIAALLSCGPDSFLSHRTAAALESLRQVNVRAIEVTVVGARAPRRPGLIVHRTTEQPADGEIRTRGLLRFSSVPRMLVELAPRETDAELDRLVTAAARRGLLHPDAMEATLTRHARRPGVGRVRQALGRYLPQPDRASNLERAFDSWLLDHPEIPQPLRNVHIAGWEVDCWWPQQQVALELDGRAYHLTVKDMDRDRLKDTKLQLRGIRVIRVTDDRWEHDRPGVHADLCGLLGVG